MDISEMYDKIASVAFKELDLFEELMAFRADTINELEQKVSEARRLYQEASDEAFKAGRAYDRLEASVNDLRDEYLGLCEVLKNNRAKPYGHLSGLILLKQRVHAEYFRIRLTCRRMKARRHELLIESDRRYKEYMSLKKKLEKLKEDKSCGRV